MGHGPQTYLSRLLPELASSLILLYVFDIPIGSDAEHKWYQLSVLVKLVDAAVPQECDLRKVDATYNDRNHKWDKQEAGFDSALIS